ncbi:MAG: Imm27 family immunity protein [Ferrovibrio sp.]|uniref:Imm27 family immunity protein n=1 Tax=Ferrovibrio sp. TaxID=1917215 RepID=UPI00391D8987
MTLQSNEFDLRGSWDSGQPDVICRRIERLISGHLEKIGADASGWDTLFRDPNDKRLWELTYPESHLHGGGPSRLTVIPAELAKRKYNSLRD